MSTCVKIDAHINSVTSFIELVKALSFLTWNPVTGSIIFTILTIIGAIGQARDTQTLKNDRDNKQRKICELEDEKRSMLLVNAGLEDRVRSEVENNYQLAEELISSYKRIAHLWMCQVFNELGLGVKHRISIYYLDSEKSNFVLLDRFAKNYEFNMPGRPFFPRDQGVIGKAWNQGEFFEKKIPIFNRKSTNYYQYLEQNYNYPRDISSRLSMKSCTIGGFAIEDAHGHHIGVIIFESQEQNDFDDAKLREIVKRENHRLVEFISDASLRDIRPFPSTSAGHKGEDHEQKAA